MPPRSPCHLRRRGAAAIEAMIVLPLFAICLGGVFFIERLYRAHEQVRMAARRCALEYAVGGCAAMPPGCEPSLAASDTLSQDSGALRTAVAADDSFGVFERIPLLGDALDALFGKAVSARAKTSVLVPWSAQRRVVTGEFAVLCNARPRNVGRAIRDVFCEQLPVLSCGERQP